MHKDIDGGELYKDFPILERKINDNRLVYLDNASTTQKPKQVLRVIEEFYTRRNANIHRGVHTLSQEATALYDHVRFKVADFIGASEKEIVFTHGATEGINLIAGGLASQLQPDDEILLTVMEHHSNIVPWQDMQKHGVVLKYADITDDGLIDVDSFESQITKKTRIVSIAHCSNVLGTINPIEELVKIVRKKNRDAIIVVDAAQSVPHFPISVVKLGCDFLVFSGHKMLGPTGIGVLWGKYSALEKLDPFIKGSDMIKEVTLDSTTYADIPQRFEAGTPNIEGVAGLGAAIDYLRRINMDKVRQHEKEITSYALQKILDVDGITIYGPKNPESQCGVISFNLEGIHAHDVASILDKEGVAVRSGHHCAMPLMQRLGVPATVRASFYVYNTKEDVDALVEALKKVKQVFVR
jgi:cysteine desulfurase / selenocysteine lyase